jgi:hypothetical protein
VLAGGAALDRARTRRRADAPRVAVPPNGRVDYRTFMPNVIFVAPYFLETTLRFIDGAASLPGVRFADVSTDPEE